MKEGQTSTEGISDTSSLLFGLIVGALIVISTSVVIVHLGSPRELDFPAMIGANSSQGSKFLFMLAFSSGALLAWQFNPVFVQNTLLASILKNFSSNYLTLTRGVLTFIWLVIAIFMLYTWDDTRGRFSLAKYKSVVEILEEGKDCIGEGLLGKFRLVGDGFYVNGLEVATLIRLKTDSYTLEFKGSGNTPRILLTPINLKNPEGQWLGFGSDLGDIGFLACRR